MRRARVFVTLKQGMLDPQGEAVADALRRLGFAEVREARVGKVIDLSLSLAPADEAGADEGPRLQRMCEELLGNPVIEDCRYELEPGEPR